MDVSFAIAYSDDPFHSPAFTILFILLVFTLRTLVVTRSGKSPASFAVVKNNILLSE